MENASSPGIAECLAAATDTRAFIVGKDVLGGVPALFAESFPCCAAFVVADGNTWTAAGERVDALLRRAGVDREEPFLFPAFPVLHADTVHADVLVREIEARRLRSRMHCVPVAVGGGTINDLVKRAAHLAGLPYLCVPTAASVDGYTAYGAALLHGGFKRTFECAAPLAVVADSGVLAAAPARLSSSGYGDLAGKIIAGTDWRVAVAAGAAGAPGWEPVDPKAWAMTQTSLGKNLAASEAAARGDEKALETLFTALGVTGFSMQYLRSSRPVSGCEHLMSHVWEMADLSVDGVPVTHGHKVALGTLIAAALTESFFASPEPPSPPKGHRTPSRAEREAQVRAAFAGAPALDDVAATAAAKLMDARTAELFREKMRDGWKETRAGVLELLPPYGELKAAMARAGCPVEAGTIGLGRSEAIGTALKAQMIRNRYTLLDLAWDFGLLERCVAQVEADPKYL